ncbi:class II glutamine amidotransferase [Actinoallomurus sp. NBC_01490]|jgi:glutamine amidotransferase|uniref:class II glutamine amidotransferase n=1 Tax=Actinoallomurus sp. NBC_01490 TaxID=2903557 RepID=UPI002E330718|nr:class II glutamine amidotransferase [Actinoallomurus sp. NBC_01490]
MCRLFGMSSAPERTCATFWLLDAPDSLSDQSHRNPDGAGLGFFDADRTPRVYKTPIAAYQDQCFAEQAKQVKSAVFVAHLRYATTGGVAYRNTQPFEQDGRLFGHNGVIEDLDELDAELGTDLAMVEGETDSERLFALITREIRKRSDVAGGIECAARWVARNLRLYALNLILASAEELWALRYPDTHELYVLQRPGGGHHGARHLDHSGTAGRMRVHCADMARVPAVVIASEPMDDSLGWRLLEPGELLHVGPGPRVTSRIAVPEEPARRLQLADLSPRAAAAQQAA